MEEQVAAATEVGLFVVIALVCVGIMIIWWKWGEK